MLHPFFGRVEAEGELPSNGPSGKAWGMLIQKVN
jgi:hypothetical protein